MRRIAIPPADQCRRFVVVASIAAYVPREVGDERKDAPREQITLDLDESQFDRIEPRRIGRREVEVHLRMLEQKPADRLGLGVDK
jgi:hypothetical protein